MAGRGKPDGFVPLQELAVSNAYEIAAIIAMVEHKSILSQGEALDQVKRLKKTRPHGQ